MRTLLIRAKTLLIRTLVTAIVLSGVLAFVMLVRTATLARTPAPEGDARPFHLDEAGALERLSQALRLPATVPASGGGGDESAGTAFQRMLEEAFPRVHASLAREVLVGGSLLFTWEGSESALPPILLTAHGEVPVVPDVEPEARTQPPFPGTIADGFVWGRGALSGKGTVMGVLEAVEGLLADGAVPRRTVLIAVGHDLAGRGSTAVAGVGGRLEEQGIRPAWSLSGGSGIVQGGVPGIRDPVGVVGVAETGAMTVRLSAADRDRVDEAIRALEEAFPPRVRGPTREFFHALAAHMDPGTRMLVANLWLLERPVARALTSTSFTAAALRTVVDSVARAGDSGDPSAIVRLGLAPGDDPEAVLATLRATFRGSGVEVDLPEGVADPLPPSATSSSDSEGFRLIREAIHRTFPDVIAVAPAVVSSGADGPRYGIRDGDVFRFSPVRLDPDALASIGGVDERIRVTGYLDAVRFYAELIQRAAVGE